MKKFRLKIANVRNNVRLITDKQKTGGGGSWSFISLTALYIALNPLLDENNLDIEIIDSFDEQGEFLKISIVDIDSGLTKDSLFRIKPHALDKQGIQYATNREAQKSFFVRTAIISLFRLTVETYKGNGIGDIRGAKEDMEQINMLIRKLKVKAGMNYIKKIELENGKKISDLTLYQLQTYVDRVEENILKRKAKKNENK